MVVSLAVVFYQLFHVFFSFLKPPQKPNSFGGVVSLGTQADLPLLKSAPKLYPEGRFWLVHNEEGIAALHSSCSHLECRFSWDAEKNTFICPCHGSEFTRNGKVIRGPATRDLDWFPVLLFTEKGEQLSIQEDERRRFAPIANYLGNKEHPVDAEREPIYVKVDTGRKMQGGLNGS